MTIDAPTPLLPLDTFRERVGWNPWHFWQLVNSTTAPVNSKCNTLVYEYDWQNADAVGRAEIRRALVDAQSQLAEYLRFDVAPAYREDTVPWPRLADAAWSRGASIDQRGQYLSVDLPRVQTQRLGIQRTTLIGTANVTYSDTDGDGLNDTFTLSIATTATDSDEIGVYVAAVNRFDGSGLSERWRIAPVRVTLTGGTATIVGRAWTAVRPVLYERATPLDPATAGNFQATMDVARVYVDPNGITVDDCQATLLYEAIPCPWFCVACTPPSGTISTDPAAVGMAIARAGIRNAQTGTVIPAQAVYDATTQTWAGGGCCWTCQPEPDRVLVRYTAGMPLLGGQMQPAYQELVTMLALALIPGPICACKEANKRLYYYQFDLARTGGAAGESYGLISGADLSNPFGTRRGQVEAYKRVYKRRSLRGVAL